MFTSKFCFSILLFTCLLTISFAKRSSHHNDDDDDQDPNSFIDQILVTAIKSVDKELPMHLPNASLPIKGGYLKVDDVKLLEIHNISRIGNASIVGDQAKGILTINTTLEVSTTKLRGIFYIRLLFLKWKIRFVPAIKLIRFTLSANFNPTENTIELTRFHLDKVSGVRTDLSGFGLLNPIAEKMITISADILEKFIRENLDKVIAKATKNKVFPLPAPQ